jgi:hypothetical protein
MTRFRWMSSLLVASPLLVGLGACANFSGSSFGGSTSHASAAERSACRAHADAVFERQNSDAMYRSDTYSTGLRDSPFGSSGLPGLTTTGLSQQFGVATTMQDCLNGTGGASATTDPVPTGGKLGPTTITSGAAAPATVK